MTLTLAAALQFKALSRHDANPWLRFRRGCAFGAVAFAVAVVGGCQARTEEQRVEAARAGYRVQLQTFTLKQQPLTVEPSTGTAAATDDIREPTPVRTDVLLDVFVSTESEDTLTGLTVDFEHVDAARQLKEHRLLWLDTSAVAKGSSVQLTVSVENVDYQEGDAFGVEVRSPVPPGERAAYREFAASPAP